MEEQNNKEINKEQIQEMLAEHKNFIKFSLKLCAHCTLCAESCFLYNAHNKDPQYMPSYKYINSVGTLYKKKGRVSRKTLEEIGDILWNKCVLCTRCYCPLGIDIPRMITLGRKICRSQGVYRRYDHPWVDKQTS